MRRLPHRGEQYTREAWELEVASLVEDVAYAAVGAERALALLEWVSGSTVGSDACERQARLAA